MLVHPEIAALQSDPAEQRRIQARMKRALNTWLGQEDVAALAQSLAAYETGEKLENCRPLEHLLSDVEYALRFAGSWLERITRALRNDPLGEVPQVYRCSSGLSRMQLLRCRNSALSLIAYEERPDDSIKTPKTALFVDSESHEMILRGSATGFLHRRNGSDSPVETTKMDWTAGDRIILKGLSSARQIMQVDGSMLILQLTRAPARPHPTCEYSLPDGALLQTASGDKGASQRFMAMAVLGALEHAPALDAMEKRAFDRTEVMDVRWEGVRQILGMNSARGLRLLSALRRDPHDPLHQPAAKLEYALLGSKSKPPTLEKERS